MRETLSYQEYATATDCGSAMKGSDGRGPVAPRFLPNRVTGFFRPSSAVANTGFQGRHSPPFLRWIIDIACLFLFRLHSRKMGMAFPKW